MAVTVGNLIDRLYRTWLYPPDAQPATTRNQTVMLADTDPVSFQVSEFVVPEDSALMKSGSIIEIGSELLLVTAWDQSTLTATAKRAMFGTTAVAHAVDDLVILAPPYPRQSVLEFMGDEIQGLYPKLYTVDTMRTQQTSSGVAPFPDDLAVEIISIWLDNLSHVPEWSGRIVEYHPNVGGRALLINRHFGGVWVRYRRRMERPTLETQELRKDLGVEEMWAGIVMAGVAAALFAGRDLSASHVEWVQSVLQAENIQVGTRAGLSGALLQYRQMLIDRARSEMQGEDSNRIQVRRRGHMSKVVP